jgi:hypothetical protein
VPEGYEDQKRDLELAILTAQLEKLKMELELGRIIFTADMERLERERVANTERLDHERSVEALRLERERVKHDNDMKRLEQELKLEPRKTLATVVSAIAAFAIGTAAVAGIILALVRYVHF